VSDTISTQIIEGDDPRLEVDAAELKIVGGPDRGLTVALGSDSLLIGTHPSCDIVLTDTTVSARHAEISLTAHGYFVRDLGSTNGVRVGTLAIVKAALHDGLQFELGATAISVRTLNKRSSVPLSRAGQFGDLIARSLKMRAAVATLEKLAKSDVAVLIEGETGTGKEVAAQALHRNSARAAAPFVVLDCGAVPKSLFAAELFGHERGAFTGAGASREGLLAEADGGTLFLDEIGELALDVQPLLLGAIERGHARHIGGKGEFSYDVRFVAATNRNLAEEVRRGRFRQDLYFRIASAKVRLPPLRERPEDLPALVDALAAEAGVTLSPEARALCSNHDWPGNVRELRNTIAALSAAPDPSGALAESVRDRLRDPHIYDQNGALRPLSDARRLAADDFERNYIQEALNLHGGEVQKTADAAQVSRRFISRIVTKHGLREPKEKP
jgi:DNA-binding NtrC family response regulator